MTCPSFVAISDSFDLAASSFDRTRLVALSKRLFFRLSTADGGTTSA